MQLFESITAYPVDLRATLRSSAATSHIHLELHDYQGNHGVAEVDLRWTPALSSGKSWDDFHWRYVKNDTGETDHRDFGGRLFQFLLAGDQSMREAWQGIRAAAKGGPLALTVIFGPQTERLARLPLELLYDDGGFLFARPGSALRRAFAHMAHGTFRYPDTPRLLFAWACPAGAGDPFDPTPHEAALRALFGNRLDVCPQASLEAIETALTAGSFPFVHILAHGFRDLDLGGIVLHGSGGGPDGVEAPRLANALKGKDVRLVFLCSCQTAVAGEQTLSGVAQQLLAPSGGDVPAVVATQANLPVRGSAMLASQFYQLLREGSHDPASALARARYKAYQDGNAWSVPVFLARPQQLTEDILPKTTASPLPPRRATFQDRPEQMAEILEKVRHHRLVSIVGLPGIGKTELGEEAARRLMNEGFCQRLVYPQINRTTTPDLLRALIGTAIGLEQLPQSDAELGAALGARSTLLLLDNAEDLMLDDRTQGAFRAQLDTLLASAPNLRVLLTTRWLVSGTREREMPIDMPPMPREQAEQLLIDELREGKVFLEEWTAAEDWQRLLDLLDGHPRSIWLVSRHFENSRMSPRKIVARLEKYKAEAIVDPSLFGRRDVFESLSDVNQQRMLSLKASIDFSFDVLRERHPDATEAFLALSLFPAGLPEYVALEVTGGRDGMALENLYRYHLMEWDRDRTFYPVPLRWYAEQRRQGIRLDETIYFERGLNAYADYVEICDRAVVKGDITGSMEKWLLEEETLLLLSDWSAQHEAEPSGASSTARIASSGRNILNLTDRLESWRMLTENGLKDARRSKDRSGEANCLQGLGELAMRVSDLEGAARNYQEALPLYREIKARLGEANCLQGLGDLAMRVSDLEGAARNYQEALPLYREIKARLGEANCLQGLGDLEGAARNYQEALPLYREIKDRLGEANCLQSLGLLALAQDKPQVAFEQFVLVLSAHRAIDNRMGEQADFGYLARTAAMLGRVDQALVLAGKSLDIGRAINDRFGETITLDLIIQLLQNQQNIQAMLVAIILRYNLALAINDQNDISRYQPAIDQIRQQMPGETWTELESNAEAILAGALLEAEERLGGRDPLKLE